MHAVLSQKKKVEAVLLFKPEDETGFVCDLLHISHLLLDRTSLEAWIGGLRASEQICSGDQQGK